MTPYATCASLYWLQPLTIKNCHSKKTRSSHSKKLKTQATFQTSMAYLRSLSLHFDGFWLVLLLQVGDVRPKLPWLRTVNYRSWVYDHGFMDHYYKKEKHILDTHAILSKIRIHSKPTILRPCTSHANSIAMRLGATIQAQSLQAPRSDANDVGRGRHEERRELDDDIEWIFFL